MYALTQMKMNLDQVNIDHIHDLISSFNVPQSEYSVIVPEEYIPCLKETALSAWICAVIYKRLFIITKVIK